MKRLVGVVQAHARRHRELLDKQWERTEWTRVQAEQVLRRIDGVLELLPRARKQAHERIIGGRQVANADKILSLYDTDGIREPALLESAVAVPQASFGG